MRVFLVIVGWMLGGAVVMALLGYWAWSTYGDEYTTAFAAATKDGLAVAESGTDQDCYDGLLERFTGCTEVKCTLESKIFADTCFKNVKQKTSFCDDVPGVLSLMEYLTWIGEQCDTYAPDNDGCDKVFQEVARYCSAGKKP